tara:strand:- start:46 stop:444 length:399 start_codon:yes stop_codon:yes gene_type:complete
VIAQRRDVVVTLAQRWQSEIDDVEPKQQVLAEIALLDLLVEVAIAGCQQADVDLDRGVAADSVEFALRFVSTKFAATWDGRSVTSMSTNLERKSHFSHRSSGTWPSQGNSPSSAKSPKSRDFGPEKGCRDAY